jgi:hypothetical protein
MIYQAHSTARLLPNDTATDFSIFRFWYGNEGGNRNNFETKEECNEVCVDPEGKKVIYKNIWYHMSFP